MLANSHPVIAERKKITNIEYVIEIKVSVHCIVPQGKLDTWYSLAHYFACCYYILSLNSWFNFLQRY